LGEVLRLLYSSLKYFRILLFVCLEGKTTKVDNDYRLLQDLTLLLKILKGTRKDTSKNWQFGHAISKRFTSPLLW